MAHRMRWIELGAGRHYFKQHSGINRNNPVINTYQDWLDFVAGQPQETPAPVEPSVPRMGTVNPNVDYGYGHDYIVRSVFCNISQPNCTVENVGDASLQYSYPNLRLAAAPYAKDGRPIVVFGPGPFDSEPDPSDFVIPGGRILQSYDALTLTITNTTLRDHVFCCGTITRGPQAIGDSIYLVTRGIGTNAFTGFSIFDNTLDRFNQRQGPIIFRALDQQARSYFDKVYEN
jgi:hypothetical protein